MVDSITNVMGRAGNVYVPQRDLAECVDLSNGDKFIRLKNGVRVQFDPKQLETQKDRFSLIRLEKGYTSIENLKSKKPIYIGDSKGDDKIVANSCKYLTVGLSGGNDFVNFTNSEDCQANVMRGNKGSGSVFGGVCFGAHPDDVDYYHIPGGFEYKAK